jgi:hypothetical protein
MEGTTLNMILVFSFLFVSVALGVRWIGEIIIQVIITRHNFQIQEELFEAFEEEEEDER